MLRTLFTRVVFAGALLSLSGATALAFNPQPDPPGDIPATGWQIRNLPMCVTGEHITSGRSMMMRKAGGTQEGVRYYIGHTATGAKCLNPQPLPPG